MKTSGFLISLVVFAGIVMLATSMEINALQIAAVSTSEVAELNNSLVTYVENTTTKFENVEQKLTTAGTEITTGVNLFNIFQLSQSLVSIVGDFMDILFSVPSALITVLAESIPGMPPAVPLIAGLCLLIFAAIKVYHELRGTSEV